MNRCILSPFAEVYITKHETQYNGSTYLGNISNITFDSIASLPVKVCFCNTEYHATRLQLPAATSQGQKRETFLLQYVNKVTHLVDAAINSSLAFPGGGGFGEGQQTKEVNKSCIAE